MFYILFSWCIFLLCVLSRTNFCKKQPFSTFYIKEPRTIQMESGFCSICLRKSLCYRFRLSEQKLWARSDPMCTVQDAEGWRLTVWLFWWICLMKFLYHELGQSSERSLSIKKAVGRYLEESRWRSFQDHSKPCIF